MLCCQRWNLKMEKHHSALISFSLSLTLLLNEKSVISYLGVQERGVIITTASNGLEISDAKLQCQTAWGFMMIKLKLIKRAVWRGSCTLPVVMRLYYTSYITVCFYKL